MTWEQKFAALGALTFAPALHMRKPGDWYVSLRGVERQQTGRPILSGLGGNGTSPEDAVNNLWAEIEHLEADNAYLVLDAMDPDKRQHLRWNGYMWERQTHTEPEPRRTAAQA